MQKVAIMQPYFFPYLGYLSLLKHTDRFVLLDDVQFMRHGWIERNRILRQGDGWVYMRVPLERHSRETMIRHIAIDGSTDWRRSILSQLTAYKRTAPYYDQVTEMVAAALEGEHAGITSLDAAALRAVCGYLGIDCAIDIFSEMGLTIAPVNAPDEWALNICQALGDVAEYWNPPGGRTFFDASKYERAAIKLRFLSVNLREYDQRRRGFVPGLSIIDVAMFNSPQEINEMLDDYVLLDRVDRSGSA